MKTRTVLCTFLLIASGIAYGETKPQVEFANEEIQASLAARGEDAEIVLTGRRLGSTSSPKAS